MVRPRRRSGKRTFNLSNRPDGLTNDRLDGMVAVKAMKRTETSLRSVLLDAAEAVVARQGVANLTLEAVAAEAGHQQGRALASLSDQGSAD